MSITHFTQDMVMPAVGQQTIISNLTLPNSFCAALPYSLYINRYAY